MDKESLKVLIVDDEAGTIGILKSVVTMIFEAKGLIAEVDSTTKTSNVLHLLTAKNYDILMLDIDMPEEDGISLAERVKESFPRTPILFVSNCEDRVFESFKVHPFGFVRKSNFRSDFQASLDAYLLKNKKDDNECVISLKNGKENFVIPLKTLMYVESELKYQSLYLDGEKDPIRIRCTISDVFDKLKDEGFIRVHRGYIVNVNYVRLIDDEDVILINGSKVPLARRKVIEIRKEYLSTLKKKNRVLFL